MAPRKHKGRARSKVKAVEEDGSPTERSGTSPKRNLPQPKPVSPGSKANDGMVTLMRQFLEAQERREERHMLELRGLRETIMQSALPAQSSMDMGSLRMDLPTPAARRVTGHYDADPDVGSPRFPAPNQPLQRAEPKIPVFQQGEDIESYLRRFERLAKTWRWPQEEWSCRLVPLLTGQALEAYLAMDEDQAEQYSELREALLAKFDVSAETYRQRFRAATVPAGESPTESYNRLKNLFNRWVRPKDHTKEEIGEIVILEQLLRVLPYDARTWVKEHEPRSGLEAAKLAQRYLNAHRGGPRTQNPKGTVRTFTQSNTDAVAQRSGVEHTSTQGQHPSLGKGLICFYCQQSGHKASVCPARKAKLTGYCYVPREEDNVRDSVGNLRNCCDVTINGQTLQALVDTGSSISLIKPCYVHNVDYLMTTSVQCVHGDIKQYPQAEVTVGICDQMFLLTVAIVDNLPADMILGRDIPVIYDLLPTKNVNVYEDAIANLSCPVLTRAQAKAGLQPLPDFDDSLLQGGTKGPRKSRQQRRFEKYLGTPVAESSVEGLSVDGWEIPENIVALQRGDVTLKPLFEKVECGKNDNVCNERYVVLNDVLYLQTNDVTRLIVPTCCRPMVLHLAHTVPWSGHLGQQKTHARICSRFHWPTLYTDVQTYCNTCAICQKTSTVSQRGRAPLQPLPVISGPFRRIAMDIVGPLEKSSSGNQYILVVSDYATRYPEAFPLRSITTPKVIQALVQLFSRVGIPEEILTDQGTNFTSKLMGQLNRQLGIKAIRTTPYHPQTDGLVERFNQTLKNMLKKFVNDTGKDWDKWLPFVLFAYREVPQASTGFSPFELLYGWQVQGPLDLLRKGWEGTTSGAEEKGIVQYVLEMRDRLERYREEAKENLQEAQKKQKLWYDKYARKREFLPGQKVLLLLPTSANKLLTKWQGPYSVIRKMGPVTYEIHHPDKGKTKQTYHVNLLKEWREPAGKEAAETSLMVQEVDCVEEEPAESIAKRGASVVDLSHLEDLQRKDLQYLLDQFPALFRQRPGRTELAQHYIHLSNPTPSRQRPYRVPERLVDPLKKEVELMMELGVIEPSTSEWCSPVVIVPKKDGTLRICIDFRRLNAQSQFDAYPMPRIDDLLERIGKAKYITTLDLCKGYWQVPLDPASRPYTAFRTPLGLHQFTVLPFGLHGAPATFQRLMDQVLQGCEGWSAAYLDDVVIYSNSWGEHLQHLKSTLQKIQNAGLTLNVDKCEWARQEARYLGYHLGNGQLRPQVDKVEAIRRSPRPTTKKEVRSFLGLIGWYRRFVSDFATLAVPLTNLLAKGIKNPIPWTEDCENAFVKLKERICADPVLQSPDFTQRFLVQVDASATGLGAVLLQGATGEERPVTYLSRKLLPRETRYSAVEKECLAIKWALESLRYYLLGREFDLETDHRALTWIHSMKDRNSRVTRWYLSLQPYNFKVRHRPGKQNVVADYLSRFPASARLREGGDNVTEEN
ncbi:uncharacterized protein [Paramisgurnus dabryanus]|uniref:uncharacterized protein n=1 Tax=Paramisgurnus dabryanus TaxID=90735 RepID=UPI003CCF69C9